LFVSDGGLEEDGLAGNEGPGVDVATEGDAATDGATTAGVALSYTMALGKSVCAASVEMGSWTGGMVGTTSLLSKGLSRLNEVTIQRVPKTKLERIKSKAKSATFERIPMEWVLEALGLD
jgi:hypothetical protein